jgi:hypothetical protein
MSNKLGKQFLHPKFGSLGNLCSKGMPRTTWWHLCTRPCPAGSRYGDMGGITSTRHDCVHIFIQIFVDGQVYHEEQEVRWILMNLHFMRSQHARLLIPHRFVLFRLPWGSGDSLSQCERIVWSLLYLATRVVRTTTVRKRSFAE